MADRELGGNGTPLEDSLRALLPARVGNALFIIHHSAFIIWLRPSEARPPRVHPRLDSEIRSAFIRVHPRLDSPKSKNRFSESYRVDKEVL